jgi:hypothetical protein
MAIATKTQHSFASNPNNIGNGFPGWLIFFDREKVEESEMSDLEARLRKGFIDPKKGYCPYAISDYKELNGPMGCLSDSSLFYGTPIVLKHYIDLPSVPMTILAASGVNPRFKRLAYVDAKTRKLDSMVVHKHDFDFIPQPKGLLGFRYKNSIFIKTFCDLE